VSDHTITDYIHNQPPAYQLQPIGPIATLRDQFAMAALTGMCADPELTSLCDRVAKHAYLLADAMMEARK
jgi:hypothetical protein